MNNHEEFNGNNEIIFAREVINIALEHRFSITFGIAGLFIFACLGTLIDDKVKNKKGVN